MLTPSARRRLLATITLLGSLTMQRNASAQEVFLQCVCSAGHNYVCCQWIGEVYNGCSNYGHVSGQCGCTASGCGN